MNAKSPNITDFIWSTLFWPNLTVQILWMHTSSSTDFIWVYTVWSSLFVQVLWMHCLPTIYIPSGLHSFDQTWPSKYYECIISQHYRFHLVYTLLTKPDRPNTMNALSPNITDSIWSTLFLPNLTVQILWMHSFPTLHFDQAWLSKQYECIVSQHYRLRLYTLCIHYFDQTWLSRYYMLGRGGSLVSVGTIKLKRSTGHNWL